MIIFNFIMRGIMEKRKKLFIIGNGFDLAHDMKTSFAHFHEYLKENEDEYLIKLEKYYFIPKIDLWKNFEEGLANIDLESLVVNAEIVITKRHTGDISNMPYFVRSELEYITFLSEKLEQWFYSVEISNVPIIDKNIFSENDVFINFNYTSTLEELYDIDINKILYIHGNLIYDPQLIIGHGNNEIINEVYNNYGYLEDDDRKKPLFDEMVSYHKTSRKKVNELIEENSDFFNQDIVNISEIFILGLSLSDIDLPYLIEIKNNVKGKEINWNISYYKEEEKSFLQQQLKSIGIRCKNIQFFRINWNLDNEKYISSLKDMFDDYNLGYFFYYGEMCISFYKIIEEYDAYLKIIISIKTQRIFFIYHYLNDKIVKKFYELEDSSLIGDNYTEIIRLKRDMFKIKIIKEKFEEFLSLYDE